MLNIKMYFLSYHAKMIFTILLAIANRTLKPNPDKSARNMADKPVRNILPQKKL